jgi:hypothetical protein
MQSLYVVSLKQCQWNLAAAMKGRVNAFVQVSTCAWDSECSPAEQFTNVRSEGRSLTSGCLWTAEQATVSVFL